MKQLSLLEQARLRYPEKNDPEHVAQLAMDVIRELAEEPPIDLHIVASYRSIGQIRYEEMDCSGSLTPEGSGFVLRLRRAESWARQRFTGFHEVGHTFLPGYSEASVFRCQPAVLQAKTERIYSTESLADIAAAGLLFPREFVHADLAEAEFGLGTVEALANRYDAGIHASANRFVQLWPEPALLVVLETCNKPRDVIGAEPRLRVQASWAQPSDFWPWVPRWKSASDHGALARVWAGEVAREAASLDELGLEDPGALEVSARSFTYRADGELRQRVFALYRRRSSTSPPQEGRHG